MYFRKAVGQKAQQPTHLPPSQPIQLLFFWVSLEKHVTFIPKCTTSPRVFLRILLEYHMDSVGFGVFLTCLRQA